MEGKTNVVLQRLDSVALHVGPQPLHTGECPSLSMVIDWVICGHPSLLQKWCVASLELQLQSDECGYLTISLKEKQRQRIGRRVHVAPEKPFRGKADNLGTRMKLLYDGSRRVPPVAACFYLPYSREQLTKARASTCNWGDDLEGHERLEVLCFVCLRKSTSRKNIWLVIFRYERQHITLVIAHLFSPSKSCHRSARDALCPACRWQPRLRQDHLLRW